MLQKRMPSVTTRPLQKSVKRTTTKMKMAPEVTTTTETEIARNVPKFAPTRTSSKAAALWKKRPKIDKNAKKAWLRLQTLTSNLRNLLNLTLRLKLNLMI